MNAAHPMNDENDLGRIVGDIGDDLWMTVRTMRFLSRASAIGADQMASRSPARAAKEAEVFCGRAGVTASWVAIFASTSVTRPSAVFQRASSSPATSRLAGSAASYWRKARSAA